ncbi:hypothetical protein PMAYCL1PPCAC_07131 [Pristionchus mayeri]|uniref:Phosphatase n=1 Tax=Pristionchus mayeri TaxID=1317129 RepID=A0AAN5CCZ0_9BILA|nr:hypothetical protein PMAYCL1PPCAC_07131 [Pristionchus mayeri]
MIDSFISNYPFYLLFLHSSPSHSPLSVSPICSSPPPFPSSSSSSLSFDPSSSLLHRVLSPLLLQYSSPSSLPSSMRDKERLIYTVRHGERVDNVDKSWKASRKEKGEGWDDPPLTDRGMKQASETGVRLSSLPITAVFSSPFTRTIQTATQILAQFESPPPLYIEPGLAESLNACMDPPGIPSKEHMRKLSPYINWSYTPIFPLPLPKETGGDVGCYPRVAHTIQSLLDNTSGNILIVSHGSPIASSHLYLFSRWAYVGQCTISTIAYRHGNYVALSIGDSSHLSNQSNLHPIQSKKGETEKAKELESKVIEERSQFYFPSLAPSKVIHVFITSR